MNEGVLNINSIGKFTFSKDFFNKMTEWVSLRVAKIIAKFSLCTVNKTRQ